MVVAANIKKLRGAAEAISGLDKTTLDAQAVLFSAYWAFAGKTEFGAIEASQLVSDMLSWVRTNKSDQDYLNTVATVFEDTDRRFGRLPTDAEIAKALQDAGLSGPRPDLQVTPAQVTGVPMTSGFSLDPVNMASGNFVEVEDDFVFAPSLTSLGFRRTYNSRHRFEGPFGPGWSSFASARLALAPSGTAAYWRGPDGQEATIPLADARLPGSLGHVEIDGDDERAPLRLVFPQEGLTWHFDARGRPLVLDNGPGDRLTLTWRGDRLGSIRHARGAGLTVRWSDELDRIAAVEASDGRRVGYGYDDRGRLVAAHAVTGLRRYEWDDKDRIVAVVDADGVVECRNGYDVKGRVVAQLTPFGRHVRFWYRPGLVTEVEDTEGGPTNVWCHNEDGQLEHVTDGLGNTMTTVWTAGGQPQAVTDRRGATTSYEYDGHQRLVRTDFPDGTWEEKAWDERHRLVAVTTPAGTTTFGYDGDLRKPASIHDPEDGVTRFEHSDDGLLTALISPDGARLELRYDGEGRLVAAVDPDGGVKRYEYDAHGGVAATTSPLGHTTRFVRDAAGRVLERIDPDGCVWRTEYSPAGRVVGTVDPLGHRHEVRYGPHGKKAEEVDPLGNVTRYEYDTQGNVVATIDAAGNRWETGYDGCQQPVTTIDPLGGIWQQVYDADGEVSAAVTPAGRRVEIPRDSAGRPTVLCAATAATLVPGSTNPADLARTKLIAAAFAGLPDGAEVAVGYDAAGRIVELRRADGSTVHAEYDGCGRLVVLTHAGGGTTRFAYTPAGDLSAVTDPNGATARYRYDACRRLSEMVDPSGARTRLRYDLDGNLVERIEPTGERVRMGRDACGRLVTSTAGNGSVTSQAYDVCGRVVRVTSPTGGITRFAHDALGRTIAVTDPNGGTTAYEHDALGNVVSVTDPLGARTTHEYDAYGRLVATTDPLGRVTRRTYDADGCPTSIIEPDGTVRELDAGDAPDGPEAGPSEGADGVSVRLTLDPLGRLGELVAPDGQLMFRQAWDTDGNLVAEETPSASQGWEYDRAGHLVAHTVRLPGHEPATTQYTLDRCGRPTAVLDPVLGRVVVERDAAGRPTRVAGAGLDEQRTWRNGELTSWSRVCAGDVTGVRYVRDKAGRITKARHADGTVVDYRYDEAGQLTHVRRGDGTWRFVWDAAGRLVEEHSPEGARRFRYDAAGQLVEVEDERGRTVITWDSAGRRESEAGPDGVRRYEWDRQTGRLAKTWFTPALTLEPAAAHDLSYDILGRLTAVDDAGVAWDPAEVVPRLTGVGTQRLAGPPDVPALVDPSGAATWVPAADDRHDVPGLDPWGTPWPGASGGSAVPIEPGGAAAGLAIGHRQELSVDGLVWLRARAYDPATRSFLSPDPLPPLPGAPWTHNTYQYAANDPVNFCDPLGLQALQAADLDKIKARWKEGWWSKHWETVAGVGLAIAGVALMFTGVGGPAGVALLLASGAMVGAGFSMAFQNATTGEVNWATVGRDALIGMASAGVAGLIAKPVGVLGTHLISKGVPVVGTKAIQVGITGVSEGMINIGGGMVVRAVDEGGPPVLDTKSILYDGALGLTIGGGVEAGAAVRSARQAARAAAANATLPVDPTAVPSPDISPGTLDGNVDLLSTDPAGGTTTLGGPGDGASPTGLDSGPNGGTTSGPNDAPNDSGPNDGTPSDAPNDAPNDSGPSDAPNDSGPSDAPNDGTTNDGTPNDAGPNDAPNDGTPNDGTTNDGTPNDAGPNDAPNDAPNDGTPGDDPSSGQPIGGPRTEAPASGADPVHVDPAYVEPDVAAAALTQASVPSASPSLPTVPPPDMPPPRALDNEAGWRYGQQAWDGVGSRLRPEQHDALLDYGGSAHMGINGNLRSGWPRRTPYMADQINAIDGALDQMPTPEPLQTVRVTSSRAYDRPMDQIERTVQRDDGYMSTRLGDEPTHGDPDAMWEGRDLVIAHTYVPQGTPAIFMNQVADYLRGGELLLGRGLPRYVTNARQIDGVWHVDEVIYPPGTYQPPAPVRPDPPIVDDPAPPRTDPTDGPDGPGGQEGPEGLGGGGVTPPTSPHGPLGSGGPGGGAHPEPQGAGTTVLRPGAPRPSGAPQPPVALPGVRGTPANPAQSLDPHPAAHTGPAGTGGPPGAAASPTSPPDPVTTAGQPDGPTPIGQRGTPVGNGGTVEASTAPSTAGAPDTPRPGEGPATPEAPSGRTTNGRTERPDGPSEPGGTATSQDPAPARPHDSPEASQGRPDRPIEQHAEAPNDAPPGPGGSAAGETPDQPTFAQESPGTVAEAPDRPAPAHDSTDAAAAGPPEAADGPGVPPPPDPSSGTPTPPPPVAGAAPSPTFPRRVPSRWEDIADPRFANDPDITARFRDHDSWEAMSTTQRRKTGAFVTVDGELPPRIASRPDVQADPKSAIHYSGKGDFHAEDKLIASGDIRDAVQDAAEQALRNGERVTVRLVISRTPCNDRCSVKLPDYVNNTLPGQLVRPHGVSAADWEAALRNVDLELHTPQAYEGRVGDTTTGDLLRIEHSGLRVVVFEEAPGSFRTGNDHGLGGTFGEGSGGEALNDTLAHLDDYRASTGNHPPRHWTDAANPPGGAGAVPPGPPSGPTGGPVSGGPSDTTPSSGSEPVGDGRTPGAQEPIAPDADGPVTDPHAGTETAQAGDRPAPLDDAGPTSGSRATAPEPPEPTPRPSGDGAGADGPPPAPEPARTDPQGTAGDSAPAAPVAASTEARTPGGYHPKAAEKVDAEIDRIRANRHEPIRPGRTGRPVRDLDPSRFPSDPADDAALADAVRRAGPDRPEEWIGHVNPRATDPEDPTVPYSSKPNPYNQNCGDAVRCYADARQGGVPRAAAGDRWPHLGTIDRMNDWAGVAPTNRIIARDADDLADFQQRAWDHVARQLEGKPPGTVAIVGVQFEPYVHDEFAVPRPGHYLAAEVAPGGGIKWVEPTNVPPRYADWPPTYPARLTSIESVYREGLGQPWRTGDAGDHFFGVPRHPDAPGPGEVTPPTSPADVPAAPPAASAANGPTAQPRDPAPGSPEQVGPNGSQAGDSGTAQAAEPRDLSPTDAGGARPAHVTDGPSPGPADPAPAGRADLGEVVEPTEILPARPRAAEPDLSRPAIEAPPTRPAIEAPVRPVTADDIARRVDDLIRDQPRFPRPLIFDEWVGRPMREVFPERFMVRPGDDAALADAVRVAGRDNPAAWIGNVNPRYSATGTGPFDLNCAESMRAYATTRQTSTPMAAAGDRAPHVSHLLDTWTGVAPTNAIYADGLADLDAFQGRAWDHVAQQLDGRPPGTVAIVTVRFEPIVVDGTPHPTSGHILGAEVAPDGLKWVDPQTGVYRDWPPAYPNRVTAVESVYREAGGQPWMTGGPDDLTAPRPVGPRPRVHVVEPAPIRHIDGGGLQAHEHLPTLSGNSDGHTLRQHTSVSDADMAARLAAHPNMASVSTFDSPQHADMWVDRTLERNQDRIADWLANSTDNRLRLDEDFTPAGDKPGFVSIGDNVTGRAMFQGSNTAVPTTGVKVVLERRPPGSSPAYLIVMSFPTNPVVPSP